MEQVGQAAPLAKENLITCKHLLTMTSGLDDTLGDDVSPANLQLMLQMQVHDGLIIMFM